MSLLTLYFSHATEKKNVLHFPKKLITKRKKVLGKTFLLCIIHVQITFFIFIILFIFLFFFFYPLKTSFLERIYKYYIQFLEFLIDPPFSGTREFAIAWQGAMPGSNGRLPYIGDYSPNALTKFNYAFTSCTFDDSFSGGKREQSNKVISSTRIRLQIKCNGSAQNMIHLFFKRWIL